MLAVLLSGQGSLVVEKPVCDAPARSQGGVTSSHPGKVCVDGPQIPERESQRSGVPRSVVQCYPAG